MIFQTAWRDLRIVAFCSMSGRFKPIRPARGMSSTMPSILQSFSLNRLDLTPKVRHTAQQDDTVKGASRDYVSAEIQSRI